MNQISHSDWDVCTAEDLLEEAAICLRAVEQEVQKKMSPEKAKQVTKVRKAVEDLLQYEREVRDCVINNHKKELEEMRKQVKNTNWDDVPPPTPPTRS